MLLTLNNFSGEHYGTTANMSRCGRHSAHYQDEGKAGVKHRQCMNRQTHQGPEISAMNDDSFISH